MPVLLHVHSWYSLLEGVSSLEMLLERALTCGYSSLALTDTNNLYGAVRFTELAQRRGLRPLLGACLRQGSLRCVALVAEPSGYSNLCRIISRLHLEVKADGKLHGADGHPQLTLCPLLQENAAGLHVLVADLELAERLREAYGSRLWWEVVRPGRPESSARQEQEALAAVRRLGLRAVASTAVHLATPGEYHTFRLIAAVRQRGLLGQLPARLAITPAHHLVTRQELQRRFADVPEAVANSDRLAEQLRSDVLPRDTVLPPAQVPRSLETHQYLRLLCERGLRRRQLGADLAARQRLHEELAVIAAGGLDAYFLVVRDIARYARRRHFSMALRGSAGNSLVCYLLEITDVNPLRFDLPLERFLHPGRPDLPDIDLDFDWKVRDEVIAHVFGRHGPDHTAMISSHLFLQPRSAFREAAKLHGLSNEQISQAVDSGPWTVGSEEGVAVESRELPTADSRVQTTDCSIMHDARLLLGRPHHLSIHPGGVVITPRPIEEYVPLERAPKGIVITQFEKDAIEHAGLVKIDLLGNRALATVDEAVRIVASGGWRVASEWSASGGAREENLSFPLVQCPVSSGQRPLDTGRALLDLLRRGDTLGVNQLESPAMRHLLVQLQPDSVDDVIAALALIRPGAAEGGVKEHFLRRRRGLEAVAVHARLETLLRATQGFTIFEDDAARVVQALTGWPASAAYRFYKRLIKYQEEAEGLRLAAEFTQACAAQGIQRAVAAEQLAQLGKFRRYAFCKSHAVSYGLIAWKACALKAQAPLAFWTAALNNNAGMYPRRVYVEAVKRAGIALYLPCINRSQGPFCIEGQGIRVGLDAIATLPAEVCSRLLDERQRHGPYGDLDDLCRRVQPGPEALAALIRCGALDYTGWPRPALFLAAELHGLERERQDRQRDLFPEMAAPLAWMPADYAMARRLGDEWELLGFVVGPPLLTLFAAVLPAERIQSCAVASHVGRGVCVAGLVAATRHTTTSTGRDLQFLTLEDETGLIEVTLFAGTCPPLSSIRLGPYLVRGIVEDNLGAITINAREVSLLG